MGGPFGYDMTYPPPDAMMDNTMFNPMAPYEQAYLYYRCMCMQLDYKIKCKEYEKLCGKNESKSDRRIE